MGVEFLCVFLPPGISTNPIAMAAGRSANISSTVINSVQSNDVTNPIFQSLFPCACNASPNCNALLLAAARNTKIFYIIIVVAVRSTSSLNKGEHAK